MVVYNVFLFNAFIIYVILRRPNVGQAFVLINFSYNALKQYVRFVIQI